MSRSVPLRPGCAYSFLYPRHNYVGLPARTELRRLIVETVRDTLDEPLDGSTVSVNPSLRRGRWLVTGHDLDRDAPRSFYADSMVNVRRLSADEREPYRHCEYMVLSTVGRVAYQSARLGEAINFLLNRQSGMLCKVLGYGLAVRKEKRHDGKPRRNGK